MPRKRTPLGLPIIRTSERRDFLNCWWRWYQAWRMGYKPLGQEATPLLFGTWVHMALAEWYKYPGLKRGPHPAETFAEVAEAELMFIRTEARSRGISAPGGTEFLIEEKLVPAKELGIIMLEGYVREYGTDPRWNVIEPERSGQVDVLDPRDPKGPPIAIYAFTYDLIYRDEEDGYVKLGEHKTAKALSLDHLPLDPQAGSYWAVAEPHLRHEGLMGPKERLHGIEYNFLIKRLPDERPRNKDGYCTNLPKKEHFISALAGISVYEVEHRGKFVPAEKATVETLSAVADAAGLLVVGDISANQPKPLFHREMVERTIGERQSQIKRIQNEALIMNALRRGDLPLTKNTNRECSWCNFNTMCTLDEQGRDTSDLVEATFRQQDPYAAHRKSTEE